MASILLTPHQDFPCSSLLALFLLLHGSEESLSSLCPPIRQLWTAIRSLPSLRFFRLKRPSSLSLSLHITFSSLLIITSFASACPSLSCTKKWMRSVLQGSNWEERSLPGGWLSMLHGHIADSGRSAAGLLFCTAAFQPVGPEPVVLHGLMTEWRDLSWIMSFLLAHFSVLLGSLGIAAWPYKAHPSLMLSTNLLRVYFILSSRSPEPIPECHH